MSGSDNPEVRVVHDRTHTRRGWRALAALAAFAAVPVLVPGAADAAPREVHCAMEVTGQLKSGELVTTEMECFGTQAEALASVGVDASARGAARLANIAIHYDGFNHTGSSLAVTGTTCSGWHNFGPFWINRISSTQSGCDVRFYDVLFLGPPSETVFSPGGNLSTLNNNAESAEYL